MKFTTKIVRDMKKMSDKEFKVALICFMFAGALLYSLIINLVMLITIW